MAAPSHPRHYTAEEYLALERQAPYKSEYVAGQIVAMSGASRAHSLITGNLFRVLSGQLLDRPCEAHASDLRVKVSARGLYTYPDIVVVCGDAQFEDAAVDTLLNPTLIVEVLSPSTEAYDRGAKFGYYRQAPSLREYVLIAQDRMLVEQYVRADAGWLLTETSDPAARVEFPAIGCAAPLSEIYRKVALTATP
jgi:Uma2 family endonuclease